jgi:hypothetical protein
LKNYNNEIDKFIDWLKPYLKNEKGTIIGWKWYEEDMSPTVIEM